MAGPRWHAYNKRTCRGKIHEDVGSCDILVITVWPGLERRCCLKALLGSCHASFVTDYARAIWLECNKPVAKLGLLLAIYLCVCMCASAFMAVSGFRTQAHVFFLLVGKEKTNFSCACVRLSLCPEWRLRWLLSCRLNEAVLCAEYTNSRHSYCETKTLFHTG